MQRVTSMLPSWDRTKKGGKQGFDKVWGWADKLGAPINRFSNKIGSEAFWPTQLDRESDKAARILRSFCKDGFYAEEALPPGIAGPNQNSKQRILKKIPQKVVKNAVGMAIFTTMRTGLWISGAGGSGVLVARLEDGSWSPPSGIMLHTAGIGFLVGVDIYDCVVVINSRKTLESFTKIRATLGGEISAVAGPVGVGGVLENDGKWKEMNKPVFTYLKSRGFYAGVQLDGTVIIERTDENERFYGEKVSAAEILAGKVRYVPKDIKMLMETLKLAEGRKDVDQELMQELEGQPAPGDVDIESTTGFGIPEPDDPDPFGVLALEAAGMEIRESGTHSRAHSSQFEYKPSPTSPIFPHLNRASMDTTVASSRGSYMGNSKRASSRTVQSISMGTQTDLDDRVNPTVKPANEEMHNHEKEADQEAPDVDYTQIDLGPYSSLASHNHSSMSNGNSTATREQETSERPNQGSSEKHIGNDIDSSYNSDDGLDDDEPVVFEAARAATATPRSYIGPSQVNAVKARGNVVTIPPRPTPPLPPRSSARGSRTLVSSGSENGASPLASPRSDGFESVKLNGSLTKTSPVYGPPRQTNGSSENEIKIVNNTDDAKKFEKESNGVEVTVDQYFSQGNPTSEHSSAKEGISASMDAKDSSPISASNVPLPSSDLPDVRKNDETQVTDSPDAVDAATRCKETVTMI